LAFSNYFRLEVDSGWIYEEARLYAYSLNNPLKTGNRVVKAGKFKGQSKLLGIFDSLRLVLELKHERVRTRSDTQLNMAFGIFIILILFLFFLLLLAEWVHIVCIQVRQVLILGLLLDRHHYLRVHIIIRARLWQNEVKFGVLTHI